MDPLGFAIKSNYFEDTIQEIIKIYRIGSIIETGTYRGAGSTVTFAKTGLPITTIESCKAHYDEAVINLSEYPKVTCLHGSSLQAEEMMQFIRDDDIYTSDLVSNRSIAVDGGITEMQCKNFYQSEVMGFGSEVPEYNLLGKIITEHLNTTDQKILVFLDSAGGVGYLEFLSVMALLAGGGNLHRVVLVLDDVTHVKHFRSVVWLNQRNFKPQVSPDGRFAYCSLEGVVHGTSNIL